MDLRFYLANCIPVQNADFAIEEFREVIKEEEQIFGELHWRVGKKYQGFGNYLFDIGDFSNAATTLEKALNIFTKKFG